MEGKEKGKEKEKGSCVVLGWGFKVGRVVVDDICNCEIYYYYCKKLKSRFLFGDVKQK